MKKILIVIPYYLPGYRSGGPQQTVQNICDTFGPVNEIYLVTMNHDYGNNEPYDVETDIWIPINGIKIMYVSPKDYNSKLFRRLYNDFNTIYACGLFCLSTIQLMLINNDGRKKLYVAPMGVFSKNALAMKSIKKKSFLMLFSLSGIFKRVIWSFTSEEELAEGKKAIGDNCIKDYIIAEDLPKNVDFDKMRVEVHDKDKNLRVIFLSRIVPKKNLLQAINILCFSFIGTIQFDIYGLKEDVDYWDKCEIEMKKLLSNVKYRYCGSLKPEESITTFAKYDLFLFPTQGENFGHVIYESLAAGCLPLIADTTPWKDFEEKKCGNVVNLDDMDEFRRCIQHYIDMPKNEMRTMKLNAIDYAERKYNESIDTSGYRKLFV